MESIASQVMSLVLGTWNGTALTVGSDNLQDSAEKRARRSEATNHEDAQSSAWSRETDLPEKVVL